MMVHSARSVRRIDGWHRWFGQCVCGWTYQGTGKFDADRAVMHHMLDNPDETPAPVCDCYELVSMEYGPNHPCDVCKEKVS